MSDIVPFKFNGQSLRSFVDERGEPWFVAKDVCEILEHTNSRVALMALDEDEKGVRKVYTPGGQQDMATINESGLYNLIFRSNKPAAKAFRKWVTSEVLPSIRKTGGYIIPGSVPDYSKELETMQHRIDKLERKLNGVITDGKVTYEERVKIRDGVNKKTMHLCNVHLLPPPKFYRKIVWGIWKALNAYFGVRSYVDIPSSRFLEAMECIEIVVLEVSEETRRTLRRGRW